MRLSYAYIVILCLSIFQATKADTQVINTEQYSFAEGLSNSHIQGIMQDSYGLMWISTKNGLNVFDGYTFKVFKNDPGNSNSLINNSCWQVSEDEDRNIWVGADEGVSKYDRIKNEFINYDLAEILPDIGSSEIRVFQVFFASDSNVWAATGGGDILHYDLRNDTWSKAEFMIEDSSRGIGKQRVSLAVVEDMEKRVWAGSFRYGLLRYDTEHKVFRPAHILNQNINFTRLEDQITALYSDPTGILWITTRTGIYRYDPGSKNLKTIKRSTVNQHSFWNYFNNITQDQFGNIWIPNNQRGILKFDGISDDFEQVRLFGQNFNIAGLSDNVITRVFKDQTGIIWFGTVSEGLLKYDPYREPFVHHSYDEKNEKSISGSQVFGIAESKKMDGKIFVGIRGGGLNIYDPQNGEFSKVLFDVYKDTFGGSVRAIYEEDDGNLWLGTWGDGLLKMSPNFKVVERFTMDSTNTNSISDNLVRNIKEGPDNNLWIGTNKGLNIFNRNTNEFTRISDISNAMYSQHLIDLTGKILEDTQIIAGLTSIGDLKEESAEFEVIRPRNYLVVSIGEGAPTDTVMYDYGWLSDRDGKEVWSAVEIQNSFYAGGSVKNRIKIDLVHLKPGKYSARYKSDDSHSYGQWNAEPPTKEGWWGIQVVEVEDKTMVSRIQKYLKKAKDQILIRGHNIRSIHVSADGIVWIGSDQFGLNRYDSQKNVIKTYSYDVADPNSISDNSIQYIYEDEDGILWLATNNGLNRFDPQKEIFKSFTVEDGLPTNYIASILPGDNGELWLATRNGISRMVIDNSTGQITFVNYDVNDGLGGTDFIALVALKSSAGMYYFGGEHGLNEFTPGRVNETPPSLILSDFKISNRSVLSPKSELKLEKSLYDLKNLVLPHDQNDLSFEYSALHFSNPGKNQYAHKLEGYDLDWIYDNSRNSTYTNLDPGNYSFKFKGTNRDGLWNEAGKSITIQIKPPWWRTIWAYIGYGLLFIGIVAGIDRIQRRRLIAKTRERMRIKEAESRAEKAELQARAAEAERRALEAENERKTQELEEARQLQLSMLPKDLPQLPNLDIAVYMKTATEVGGDYYDFHVSLNGALTVVVGDATGHGMKAGTMVTTAKSLFNSYAPNPDILFSFKEITRCIKQMNLGKMSMCMTMLKIEGRKLMMSSAGMPPAFVYRNDTQVIEEHLLQGMPLGTMKNFPYKIKDTTMAPGDTILLLTDGLPELTNKKNEQFGYKQVRNIFEEAAGKKPEEIINALKDKGSEWVNDEEPDDDITFVVIKVK